MRIFKKTADIQAFITRFKAKSRGFVPTMGALHQGHLDLIHACRQQCEVTVASIFVNPTQFNNSQDLERYPRTIGPDILALEQAGCDVLFLPDVTEIYPKDYQAPHYELGELETVFEGAFRPGHFQGVCQVLDRLFTIIRPQWVFFGQKDYQQCRVVAELIARKPAFQQLRMELIPTRREADGLAMSSRNRRLTDDQRSQASVIYQALEYIKAHLRPDSQQETLDHANALLTAKGLQPEYIALADADTLEPVENWDGQQPLVALIAAYLGAVRLIDNMLL